MAERRIGVRMQVIDGGKMKSEFADIGNVGGRALKGIEGQSKRTGFAMQNAAFQVGDFFVQMNSGQGVIRPLTQQLPQLLGSFGLFGAVAGAAFAAVAPFVGKLFEGVGGSEAFKTALDDLDTSAKTLEGSIKLALSPMDELRRKFGDQAGAVRELYDAQLALDRVDYAKKLSATSQALSDSFSSLPKTLELIDNLRASLADPMIPADGKEVATRWLADLTGDLGMSEESARDLRAALDTLSAAEGPRNVAEAVKAVREAMLAAADGSGKIPEELEAGIQQAVDLELSARDLAAALDISVEAARKLGQADMATGLKGANTEARTLVALITDALDRVDEFARKQQALAAAGKIYSGRGGDPRTSNDTGNGRFVYTGPPLDANNNPIIRTSRGGGGADPGLAEAKRLFEETQTSAEKYAAEVEKINELHRMFGTIVTDEVRARALEKLKEDFVEVGGVAKEAASAIRSAFDNLFDDPQKALKDLAKQLVQLALYKQLATSFPGAFGAGGVIPLLSFAGGGFTGSGSRAGGLDGKGGFPAILHPNETVTDHTKGGYGGTSVQVINNSGQPARAERSRGPDGREVVKVIVGEELARGGFDKPMAGRFQSRPQPVRR